MKWPFESKEELMQQREMAHAERLKAIEMGQPIPEVEIARAKMEEVRARADAGKTIVLGIMRAVAQVGIFGIAVGATAVLLTLAKEPLHLVGVIVIWTCAAIVSLAVILSSVLESPRVNFRRLLPQQPSQPGPDEEERLMHAIQK